MASSAIGIDRLLAEHPKIWEFPQGDFLVCAREDVHGLFILSPTASAAWEILKQSEDLSHAAHEFAELYGIPIERALEDLASVRQDWSSGLLAKCKTAERDLVPNVQTPTCPPVFCADYFLFGRAIRLRLFQADIALDVVPRVEPLRTAPADPQTTIDVLADGNSYQVLVDGRRAASEESLYAARVVVLQEFLKASGPEKWLAVLHAGACGSELGCIIFPACSHSGKTTLAAALLRQGWTFHGDDSVPLEWGSSEVRPMPFALMIREGSWPAVSDMFPELNSAATVDRWGEKVRFLAPPIPTKRFGSTATVIVFTQYRAGNRIELERLPHFDALLRLNESGLWLEHDPESIGTFLNWFGSLPSYSLTYSGVDEAGEVLRNLLGAHPTLMNARARA